MGVAVQELVILSILPLIALLGQCSILARVDSAATAAAGVAIRTTIDCPVIGDSAFQPDREFSDERGHVEQTLSVSVATLAVGGTSALGSGLN